MPAQDKPLWIRRLISTVRWPGGRGREGHRRDRLSPTACWFGMDRKGNAPAVADPAPATAGAARAISPAKDRPPRRRSPERRWTRPTWSTAAHQLAGRGTTSEGGYALVLGDVVHLLLRFKGGERFRHQPDLGARLISPYRTVWILVGARNLIGRCGGSQGQCARIRPRRSCWGRLTAPTRDMMQLPRRAGCCPARAER